ncbi:glutaredoxin-C9-like [Glycine soja]|uniref:Glutaredoxin-C9 n=1 Tax=Glycine soja TaxID=3848 RepID=A0A445HT71_GLYSO|nr:glutaredoxin-C9-like [Glycine soja]RZB76876.1 Glutaredoxin-C9 [Glycine soja]
MHQAIPYRSWRPLHNLTTHFSPLPLIAHSHNDDDKMRNIVNNNNNNIHSSAGRMVLNMVSENAVIVIGRRGCCMSHVVKHLLLGLGVNPAVYEVEEKDEEGVAKQLEETVRSDGNTQQGKVQFPAVFIGGKLFGGLDRIMATHIYGELVPILKKAGALWL